jgi:hypothetical protein
LLLRVKTQYRQYEPGEFDDLSQHTNEDTLRIIGSFPWERQRDNRQVGLTNPSVTIEGTQDDFLKLTYSPDGKFALYYFSPSDGLYEQVYNDYRETFPVIKSFFGRPTSTDFDKSGFRKTPTPSRQATIHFKDGNFTYEAKYNKIIPHITLLMIPGLLLFAFLCWIGASESRHIIPVLVAMLVPLAFIILGIMFIFLLLNHHRLCKGKQLKLSRGLNEFYYGEPGSFETFRKNEVIRIITHGQGGSREAYSPLTWVELEFRNGTTLNLSCLLIDRNLFVNKFPGATLEKYGELFPFIPRDVGSPS